MKPHKRLKVEVEIVNGTLLFTILYKKCFSWKQYGRKVYGDVQATKLYNEAYKRIEENTL